MQPRHIFWSGLVLAGVAFGFIAFSDRHPTVTAVPMAPAPERIAYGTQIQPILSDNCLSCHGLDSSTRKAGLRLDRFEHATATARKGGPAIIPGKPAQSPLIQRIRTTDPDDIMPPPKSHKTLSAAQIALLERWISEGAMYEEHWSFIPLVKPVLPAGAEANPIDRFVGVRLAKEGLAFAPEADRRTLARRASLDLVGLPPEPAAVEAFLADQRSDAYERYVDTLLTKPAYGEHRAHYWLDVVRYADSHGEHFDNYRSIWPYRDWVIKAFNSDLPFDHFITSQVAGDLLPEPSLDDLVATGFVRMGPSTAEGGSIQEEVHTKVVRDRTEAIGITFLGLTVQCAGCHDHKYDPLSQRDYYRLSAFFNNTTDKFSDDNKDYLAPVVAIPTPAEQPAVEQVIRARAKAEQQFAAQRAVAPAAAKAWAAADPARLAALAVPTTGLELRIRGDEGSGQVLHNSAPGAKTASYPTTGTRIDWGVFDRFWISPRLPSNAVVAFPDAGQVSTADHWTFSTWLHLQSEFQNADELRGEGYLASRLDRPGAPGWAIAYRKGAVAVELYDDKKGKLVVTSKVILYRREWRHLTVVRDPTAKPGITVFLDGEPLETTVTEAPPLAGEIRNDVPLNLGRLAGTTNGAIGNTRYLDVRFYRRALPAAEVARLPYADLAAGVMASDRAWTEAESWLVAAWYCREVDAEAIAANRAVAAADKKLEDLAGKNPRTLTTRERDTRATAYILNRGDYASRIEEVTPDVPAVLPRLPAGTPANRLGLARWLVSPENPLVARVIVNRFWQEIFGVGIVESAEDFGVMGNLPSHRELLDWLAVDFRESGWDVKRLFRQIVTSRTYRQSAARTPAMAEKDPANRLLARGPRFRMDGEVIRDQALAAAGLLRDQIGGPSVKPYAPPGIWANLSHKGSNTENYKEDVPDGLYRRSLYTFWKRHGPPTQLETFNAPIRDVCIARRERTNTPMQALATLNDVQYVEAARVLAERAVTEGAGDPAKILAVIVSRVLARPLVAAEQQELLQGAERIRASWKAKPAAAATLISRGAKAPQAGLDPLEVATWTLIANAVLNCDEALSK